VVPEDFPTRKRR